MHASFATLRKKMTADKVRCIRVANRRLICTANFQTLYFQGDRDKGRYCSEQYPRGLTCRGRSGPCGCGGGRLSDRALRRYSGHLASG